MYQLLLGPGLAKRLASLMSSPDVLVATAVDSSFHRGMAKHARAITMGLVVFTCNSTMLHFLMVMVLLQMLLGL